MIAQRRTINEVLAEARSRIRRYAPEDALLAATAGAVLIDTRSRRRAVAKLDELQGGDGHEDGRLGGWRKVEIRHKP